MTAIYSIIAGPLMWAVFAVFVIGCIWRVASLAWTARKKDIAVYEYWSNRYAARSIAHWIVPFRSQSMRQNPATTTASFVFHITAIVTPLFLSAHILLFDEAFGISWPALPNAIADAFTILAIVSLAFLVGRRILVPGVRYLTTWGDFALLALVALPFVTGFWAYHLMPGAGWATILHILSGQALLVAIPFTRLSHMLLFFFMRGYIGSEFGGVRKAQDW
ncbi:MAG: nitrate reductase [Desulfatibacillaceae bacterium]|nr:nitrate reductase [Desulfatibacillaceae bacterium]